MDARTQTALAALHFALIVALGAGSAAPAAGQAVRAEGPPFGAVGPERTAFARPTVESTLPPTLMDQNGQLARANPGASLDRARLAIAIGSKGDPVERHFSRTQGMRRILDIAIVTLGSSLAAGALAHYSADPLHWGMTPSELGAFGVGATLAAWGGMRVARWGGGGR